MGEDEGEETGEAISSSDDIADAADASSGETETPKAPKKRAKTLPPNSPEESAEQDANEEIPPATNAFELISHPKGKKSKASSAEEKKDAPPAPAEDNADNDIIEKLKAKEDVSLADILEGMGDISAGGENAEPPKKEETSPASPPVPAIDDDILKKLEAEKGELLEKNKSLAEILDLSAAEEKETEKEKAHSAPAPAKAEHAGQPGAAADAKAIQDAVDSRLAAFKKDISNIEKKISAPRSKEPTVSPQQVNEITSKLASFEDRFKTLDRVAEIEKKVLELEAAKKSTIERDGLFGDMGAFEEHASAAMLGKTSAPRSLRDLDVSVRKLDEVSDARFRHFDKRLEELNQRLSPRTLRLLDKLSASGDKVLHEVAVNEVKSEVDKIVNAFSFEIRGLSEAVKKITEEAEKSNFDLQNYLAELKRLDARIKALEDRFVGAEHDKWLLEAVKHEVARVDDKKPGMQREREELETLFREGVITKESFESGMKRLPVSTQH